MEDTLDEKAYNFNLKIKVTLFLLHFLIFLFNYVYFPWTVSWQWLRERAFPCVCKSNLCFFLNGCYWRRKATLKTWTNANWTSSRRRRELQCQWNSWIHSQKNGSQNNANEEKAKRHQVCFITIMSGGNHNAVLNSLKRRKTMIVENLKMRDSLGKAESIKTLQS